jgi:tetratricopeptide (TPR) repeat protein
MLEAGARVDLSECALDAGAIDDAAREASQAVSLAPTGFLPIARAALGRALARGTKRAEALSLARAAREAVADTDTEADAHVSLALAECLAACGQADEARTVASDAVGRVRARAERIGSVAWRTAYRTRVPAHARLAALAGP